MGDAMKPAYWAVRPISRADSVRITTVKVTTLEEACQNCFGTDTYHMEGKPLTSRLTELRVYRKRMEWLCAPIGWVRGRTN